MMSFIDSQLGGLGSQEILLEISLWLCVLKQQWVLAGSVRVLHLSVAPSYLLKSQDSWQRGLFGYSLLHFPLESFTPFLCTKSRGAFLKKIKFKSNAPSVQLQKFHLMEYVLFTSWMKEIVLCAVLEDSALSNQGQKQLNDWRLVNILCNPTKCFFSLICNFIVDN